MNQLLIRVGYVPFFNFISIFSLSYQVSDKSNPLRKQSWLFRYSGSFLTSDTNFRSDVCGFEVAWVAFKSA